jgi:hypothetical protein
MLADTPLMTPHHISYAVNSIDATVAKLVQDFGAGPFFRTEKVEFAHISCHGEPATWDHTAAIGLVGGAFVELQEFRSATPERLARLLDAGTPAINHVAFMAESPAEAGARLEQLGCSQFLQAKSGFFEIAFYDGASLFGHPIEIHKATPAIKAFSQRIIDATAGWDGAIALRTFAELGA